MGIWWQKALIMKKYKVKFVGTSQITEVWANSEKEAKQKFADLNKVAVSTYIVVVRK
jgi:hypothetical protein